MIKARIIATASYTPQRTVMNEELCSLVETSDEWISTRTGIKSRYISTGENTSDLCAEVARRLLAESSLDPSALDAIIIATFTGDFATPSTACIVQGKINAVNAVAFDINAACTGFVYALTVASKLIETRTFNRVMVLSGEVISKMTDWTDRNTCVLFGDGCGGVLLESGEYGIQAELLGTDGSNSNIIRSRYSPVKNFLADGDHTQTSFVQMDGRAVFDFATRIIPDNIEKLLEKAKLGKDDISHFILHQANARIISAIAKKLDIPSEKTFVNLDRYGNTSAASIPIVLNEMIGKGIVKLGSREKIILTGFGAGLTYGSVLVEI